MRRWCRRRRNSDGEKEAVKAGKKAQKIWPGQPGRIRTRADGSPLPQIAMPFFGYTCHISVDKKCGFIRLATVTSADSACRSQRNEKWLATDMMDSQIHRRKPKGKPMPKNTAKANAKKSAIRAAVEHVFAYQKGRFGLFIRKIGLARAEAKLTLANLAYNFNRLIFHETRAAIG